jgi:hypothetical protein
VSVVRLGLCCSRPESLRKGPAGSSLENAVRFFRISQGDEAGGDLLSLSRLETCASSCGRNGLDRNLREAVENEVTHVLFLSPGAVLPFYSLQSLLDMRARAVSGISWTWKVGLPGGAECHPRIGYFDPEGRAYPYFGWSAPDIFEVDWCGLDCLLLDRGALEEILEPLTRLRGLPPHLRVSLALRWKKIPILVDSFIQCPRVAKGSEGKRKLVPSPLAWMEFSRDFPARRIPIGAVYDPAYRGRAWYREWTERCRG